MFQRHPCPKEDQREAADDEERRMFMDMVILTQEQGHTGAVSRGLKESKIRKQDGLPSKVHQHRVP